MESGLQWPPFELEPFVECLFLELSPVKGPASMAGWVAWTRAAERRQGSPCQVQNKSLN